MAARALLVGIATYANPKNNLRGVENDVAAMVSVLNKFGIVDLEIIRDSMATSENIKRSLQNLISSAEDGDIRIFYYSGHGALLPPGFSGSDDPDGRDEALVPYEGSVASLITDNWMSSFLKNIVAPKNIRFWSIYDACHTGDMYKEADVEGLPGLPETAVEKIVPFEDLLFDGPPMRMEVQPVATTKALILDGQLSNSVHFGAAEPEVTALVLDIQGVRRSAFTWAFEQCASPGVTVERFEQLITAKQKEVTDHHHPQVAVNNDQRQRPLFT